MLAALLTGADRSWLWRHTSAHIGSRRVMAASLQSRCEATRSVACSGRGRPKSQLPTHIGGVEPAPPQFAQGCGAGALGKLAPVGIEDQPVVLIGGLRQVEQQLQQPLQIGGREQVAATRDVGYAL